jgi:large subunit ribosomal protein L4e
MKKAQVLRVSGGKTSDIELPIQFVEPLRIDLIQRAVRALQFNRRQPYGHDLMAGKRQGYATSKLRNSYRTTYGKGISRVRRKHLRSQGMQFTWVGAFVASAISGMKVFAPRAEKNLIVKINNKERRKAIRSAIAASKYTIIDTKIEALKKTSEIKKSMESNNLGKELERSKIKKVRAGKGTRRGRKYKTKVGPLLIFSKVCPAMLAAENIQGIDVVIVNNLNAELLAPGGQPGRSTVWSSDAIKRLKEENLFN